MERASGRWRAGSVRNRLIAGTGIGVGVALLVSGVLVYVLAKRALVAQFDEGLGAKVRALALLVEQDGGTIETDISRDAAPGEYFELWDASGVSLLRSTSLGDAHLSKRRAAVTLPTGAPGRQVVLEFAPRTEDVDNVATSARPLATLAFARSTDDIDATVARLGRILAGVGLAALLICIGILAWIARFGLRPVRVLASDIAAIRENELAARLAKTERPRELVPIVERLNDLLGRVDAAVSRERELTAAVAHELRTPLTGLRATIELALDRERSPERYRGALAECLAICRQTERMVESMLSLAKLDAGQVPVMAERVELDAIVRDVLATHAARAAERGLTIEVELAAVPAVTDSPKLASVLHNLVDNAISYSDANGTIRVELEAGPTIRISNTGCTLAAEDVARVFDRFWRGDSARTAGMHAGMGLSICKTLVGLLGGSITADVVAGRFVVTVALYARPS